MIEVGQTVGNYVVTALLGEGAMGVVFLAEHPVIGRKVALKVIHPEFSHNVEMVSLFVNEAKTISQIGHDHVVEVTDFGRTSADDFYFVMEYLEGEALSEPIERGAPFLLARAIMIAAQIAEALGAVHERGVVHCDLKPENVFLVKRGGTLDFVKVLDFGLAKLTRGDDAEPRNTQAGSIDGTPRYMSPEQCDGTNPVDARADVYALGVILFEMLTGKLPFDGDTSGEIIVEKTTMHAPAARAIVPDLPEEVDVVLQQALATVPDDRFPTMAAFRAALFDLPSPHGSRAPGTRGRRHVGPRAGGAPDAGCGDRAPTLQRHRRGHRPRGHGLLRRARLWERFLAARACGGNAPSRDDRNHRRLRSARRAHRRARGARVRRARRDRLSQGRLPA